MSKLPSRSAVLARELLGMIARRELRPGDPIDLHALGRRHGVSRTVVREALADLGGKGLVLARPKVGTTVAPDAQWNMLDPLLVGVAAAQLGAGSMLAEAVALRRVVEPALAADAARDASTAQRAALLRALRGLADAIGLADRGALAAGDAALHDAIAAACGNRLLRSIDRSLVPVRALQCERLHDAGLTSGRPGPAMLRCLAVQTALVLAIVRRDAVGAAARALELVSAADVAMPPARAHDRDAARDVRDAARPGPSSLAMPSPAVDRDAVSGATEPDDWPTTAILMRDGAVPVPARRGRLDPIEAGDAGPAVPALLGAASGPAFARAR
jgi:DNA-binding FadR family transcriptional regulator